MTAVYGYAMITAMSTYDPEAGKTNEDPSRPVVRETTEQWDDLPPGAKVVGRRRPGKVDLLTARPFFKFAASIRRPKHFIPKGIHRFQTFEEAEQWHLKMITRR